MRLGLSDYSASIGQYLQSTGAAKGKQSSNDLNQIHKAPVKDLLTYNGIDSLLEYKVAVIQKELLRWKM